MTNYWIFKVKDDTNGKYTRKGIDIYKHRMKDKAWGLEECSEKGRRTANIGSLESGDRVLFYLCGKDGHCFLGTCSLNSRFKKGMPFHEEYLDWKQGVLLTEIREWTRSLPIERLRGRVRFIPIGENYGSYIQGSITAISHEDYETVIREHMREN